MIQNMLIIMKHICEKFIFHVFHKLSHGRVSVKSLRTAREGRTPLVRLVMDLLCNKRYNKIHN